ncbi:MAG: hypothetical protein CM1200mP20_10650 [Pseudomonadota bacterium]|nr:MAG: hypothetical protein CM1200mP20_10650 [Pseudomonadota bacterium]
MSLEEAKKITAELANIEFVPPPRSISDITIVLDGKRGESLTDIERLRATTDASSPDTSDPAALFEFYRLRADAAQLVGRSAQQIADLELAVEHGRRSFTAGSTTAETFGRVLTSLQAPSGRWVPC